MMYLGKDAVGISTAFNKNIPQLWSIDKYIPSISAVSHIIPHSLGIKPDIILIIPQIYNELPKNQFNQQVIFGSSGPSSIVDYPYRLVTNFINSSNEWDYTATKEHFGWNADENNISVYFDTSSYFQQGKEYNLITIKFNKEVTANANE